MDINMFQSNKNSVSRARSRDADDSLSVTDGPSEDRRGKRSIPLKVTIFGDGTFKEVIKVK